jgi:non-specific serine/threonine protein kinase/serine/threonine-protein kinase
MSSLALAYEGEAKYPQAEALLTQTLEIEKRVLGPEHRDTLLSMHNLALVYLKEGKYPQAERLWRQTLDALNRVMGPDSPIAALVTYDMGCLAARRGDKDEAIARLSQSVDHGLLAADDLGMGEDTDLNSLHSDLRFEALVAHAKQVAEAKQKIATTETPK